MSQKRDLLMDVILACPYPLSRWMYSLGRRTVRKNNRQALFDKAFETAMSRQVEGDYLEFGVYRGTSFISAYDAARQRGFDEMRFFAFDCFEGLPEGEGTVWKPGDFAFPEHLFRELIRKAGVDPQRTTVVRGLYEHSLTREVKTQHELRRAAVVHIDCDLYSSTKVVLDFIEDIIDVGTVLMFDDWYHRGFGPEPERHGGAKAFGEWWLRDCFEVLYDLRGQQKMKEKGFVMVRRPASA